MDILRTIRAIFRVFLSFFEPSPPPPKPHDRHAKRPPEDTRSFELWDDATRAERASWALWRHLQGADAKIPPPEVADHLPITQHDEIALLAALEREFVFQESDDRGLLEFLWRHVLARARGAAEAVRADRGSRSPSLELNAALFSTPGFHREAHPLEGRPGFQLHLRELETSPEMVAALWCLLAGALRRSPTPSALPAGIRADLKTLMDRCGSLGEIRRVLSPVFEAFREDPELTPTYGRSVVRLRRKQVEAKFA